MADCGIHCDVVLCLMQTPVLDAAAAALAAVRESLAGVGQAAAPAATHFVAQASGLLEALRLERTAVAAETRKLEALQVQSPTSTSIASCTPCSMSARTAASSLAVRTVAHQSIRRERW